MMNDDVDIGNVYMTINQEEKLMLLMLTCFFLLRVSCLSRMTEFRVK